MLIEVIASFFVAYSFGVLFNIKGKYLIVAGFGGSIGWFFYKLGLLMGLSDSGSLFIAALIFSTYCEISARIFKTPTTLLSVCCLIPLVPGYGVYNTMYELLKGDYVKGMDYAISTLSSAFALALGVIFISTIFRNFKLHSLTNIFTLNKCNKNREIEKTIS
ncbi:MAG: threonine/serine exporter family protein [Peptostreptococcaceae bacterium]